MDKTTGFSSSRQQSLALKREYRILRSKVLKILDQKFFHLSEDVVQYDSKIAQMESAFKKIQNRDIVENKGSNKRLPKIFDYTAGSSSMRGTNFPMSDRHGKMYKDLETLKIENLCKYLSSKEIEMVCEDPIYFLGRSEYRNNSDLNDHKGWNKQLEWVHEKKVKEDNWKETISKMHSEFRETPSAEACTKLASRTFRPQREVDFENIKENKESMMRIQSRKIMARNNQMNSLVKIRKVEELEAQNEKGYDWEFKIKDRYEKVMEKKKEAYEMQLQDKVESRMEILRKLSLKEKEKRDHSIVARITQEIGAYYKDKVTEKAKTRIIKNRVNKAKTFTTFELRRPLFVAKYGADKNIDDSSKQSNSNYK